MTDTTTIDYLARALGPDEARRLGTAMTQHGSQLAATGEHTARADFYIGLGRFLAEVSADQTATFGAWWADLTATADPGGAQ